MKLEWLFRLGALSVFPLMAVVVVGCGYHFGAEGTGLPTQDKTIYVEKFRNRSRFTGIDDQFARYMKDEIANHKRLELVDDPSGADLVLNGELVYIATAPLATNSVSEPIDYSQTLIANAMLVDQHSHEIVWRSSGISATESYAIVAPAVVTTSPMFLQQNLRSQDIAQMPDLQVAKSQQDFSQQQALQTLAQSVYVSMSEGF
ncbi:MAG TPA: LptE family protein [Candidatus Binataceae bacterium]|nr:LptE family protein [Candidatus Binataceae bacterium]